MLQIVLNPETEARLLADADAEGMEPSTYASNVIERIYLRRNSTGRTPRKPTEVRAWLDSLAQFSQKIPQLEDVAFTRESFYKDHD